MTVEQLEAALAAATKRADQAESDLATSRMLEAPMAASLCATLKAECERQHARADQADAALTAVRQAQEQLIEKWRHMVLVAGQASVECLIDDAPAAQAEAETYRRCADELAALPDPPCAPVGGRGSEDQTKT